MKADTQQHTPGPWEVREIPTNNRGTLRAIGRVGTKYPLARISASVLAKSTADANARLIAAAPDLLDALQRILQQVDVSEPTDLFGHNFRNNYSVRLARQVLAKAEGRATPVSETPVREETP